jgi:hypothetical protein
MLGELGPSGLAQGLERVVTLEVARLGYGRGLADENLPRRL